MARAPRGRRRRQVEEEREDDERWLLTYADMITLLMALFMVLFSISSVNKAKFETLQRVLKDAFSGRVLPGGESVASSGSNPRTSERASADAAVQGRAVERDGWALPVTAAPVGGSAAAVSDDEEFRQLKRRIDRYAREHGLSGALQTSITRRGLVVRLLTDRIVFDSGRARVKPQARALLGRIGKLLRSASPTRPVQVDGHTDAQPIAAGPYPDNWSLSTARATAVVRFFIAGGMSPRRVSATGFSSFHPLASNATAGGRARNRRVEILLTRSRGVVAP